MASVKGGLSVRTATVQSATEQSGPPTLKSLVTSESVKNRFDELLGKKAPGFITSLLSLVNANDQLKSADPNTVITAAAMAAAMDLPINQNFGYAYVVPFRNGKTGKQEAQFQLGYKGYIQLAMRSGQYKTINATEVYEGEIRNVNRFTGEYEFGERTGDGIIGYMSYFKLVNGYEKYLYMTIDEMQAHAKKFSKSYKGGTERWGIADFNSMAIKTVLKLLISKYGIISIEMQDMAKAVSVDQAVLREDEDGTIIPEFEGEVIDVDGVTVDASTGEIVSEDNGVDEAPQDTLM